jgi:F0F1-type ATP synthase membrane subunit b/b'
MAVNEAARAEVERLQAVEPLTRVGDDVAGLLTSFAQTVEQTRHAAGEDARRAQREAASQAEGLRREAEEHLAHARAELTEAERIRREADAYAAQVREQLDGVVGEAWDRADREAEHVLDQARARAGKEAEAILALARQEVTIVRDQWSAVGESLHDAAAATATALASLERLGGLPAAPVLDLVQTDEDAGPSGRTGPPGDNRRDARDSASRLTAL